jgi:RNA polymerase sigma-70 factor (ECF subfamily)
MLTDKQLAGNASRGDQSALATLYDRHSTLLYSVALRITGDAASSADLLEDVFVRLWHKAAQFETAQGSLAGWMLAMIRYRAIARARHNRRSATLEFSVENMIESSDARSSALLDHHLAHDLVSVALAALSPNQREAIALAYFDGLSCEEIAGRTDAPALSVKSALRSAVQSMKNRLFDADASAAALDDIVITQELSAPACRPRAPELEPNCLPILTHARRHPRS